MTITWIMQVNLGKYDNAPKDSLKKFKRAVKSFIDMKDEDTSLIIVSDGCQIAHKTYFKEFSKIKNIKYAFVEKTTPYMYDEYNDEPLSEYHRVGTRQLGRMLVDSTLTTYLDADDVALPNHSKILALYWSSALKNNPEKLMCLNNAWYDHETVFQFDEFKDLEAKAEESVEIEGLESKWLSVGAKPGKLSINTGLISHRSHLDITWKDNDIKGLSEDTMFGNDCIAKHGAGSLFQIQTPIHVRCHNWKCWDY